MHSRINSALEKANALLRSASSTPRSESKYNSPRASPSRNHSLSKPDRSTDKHKFKPSSSSLRSKKYDWEEDDSGSGIESGDADRVFGETDSDEEETKELKEYLNNLAKKKPADVDRNKGTKPAVPKSAKSVYLKMPVAAEAPVQGAPPARNKSTPNFKDAHLISSSAASSNKLARSSQEIRVKPTILIGELESDTDSAEPQASIKKGKPSASSGINRDDSSLTDLNSSEMESSLITDAVLKPLPLEKGSISILRNDTIHTTQKVPAKKIAENPEDLSSLVRKTKESLQEKIPKLSEAEKLKPQHIASEIANEIEFDESSIEEEIEGELDDVTSAKSRINDLLTIDDLVGPSDKQDKMATLLERKDNQSDTSSHTPASKLRLTAEKSVLRPQEISQNEEHTNKPEVNESLPKTKSEDPQTVSDGVNSFPTPPGQPQYPFGWPYQMPLGYPAPGSTAMPHPPTPEMPPGLFNPMQYPWHPYPSPYGVLQPWGLSFGATSATAVPPSPYSVANPPLSSSFTQGRCMHACYCSSQISRNERECAEFREPRRRRKHRNYSGKQEKQDRIEITESEKEQTSSRKDYINRKHKSHQEDEATEKSERAESRTMGSKTKEAENDAPTRDFWKDTISPLMCNFDGASSSLLAAYAPSSLAVNTLLQNHLTMIQQYVLMNERLLQEEVYHTKEYVTLQSTKEEIARKRAEDLEKCAEFEREVEKERLRARRSQSFSS